MFCRVRVAAPALIDCHLVEDSPVIRPGSSASPRKSWIPGLGIVIALLVCIGLMAHVASIDGDTTTALSTVAASADGSTSTQGAARADSSTSTQGAARADSQTVVLTDSLPGKSQMSSGIGALELCAFLGVMCALMLLVFRSLSSLPVRSDRSAPRPSGDSHRAFRAVFSDPASRPALMVPLRV
jgi:hypothetical protein